MTVNIKKQIKVPALKIPKLNPIKLTRITGVSDTRLTKRFILDDKGAIKKESQPLFYSGIAETISRSY